MKQLVWKWLAPAALLVASTGASLAADIANGKSLAQRLCVNCHIVGPGEAGAEVTAGVPSFAAIANKTNQTRDKLQDFILNPHPPMPEVQLTNHERADLAAYILSQKE